jgi:hypothetical protein
VNLPRLISDAIPHDLIKSSLPDKTAGQNARAGRASQLARSPSRGEKRTLGIKYLKACELLAGRFRRKTLHFHLIQLNPLWLVGFMHRLFGLSGRIVRIVTEIYLRNIIEDAYHAIPTKKSLEAKGFMRAVC